MRNTLVSTDRFGDFIFSSQVYTNARDLARFGLLYLNGGVWNGERLVSEEWIDFVRTPAPANGHRSASTGASSGSSPRTARTCRATPTRRREPRAVHDRSPSHDLVIVRRGLDWGRQGFDFGV